MDYFTALGYLDTLVNYEQLPSQAGLRERRLERMQALLAAMGNPEERFRVIHVAGTKGKGSVCAMLYAVLRQCETSVGLYTSPHLESVRERIRVSSGGFEIDDRITEDDFADGILRVQDAVERTSAAHGPVTYFEALTALAF